MILHVDMDAFYASVELRDRPELRGKPVVVGGSPKGRGVIAAASYEARKYGIHSAMPASRAVKLCPSLVFVKSRMQQYAAVSKQIREIFYRYTSLVEPLSLDEAFLDVRGSQRLFGDSVSIGRQIQQAIRDELGLPSSVGVAPNKYLAKVASDLEKPEGFVVVDPGSIDEFLEPLSIARVWGVGPKTAEKFKSLGVTTIGQLRRLPRSTLSQKFGLNADHFWRLSRGQDTRQVVPDRVAKSVSHETTFAVDIEDREALIAWLFELADQVGRRLRRHRIFGKTVQIKVRFSDFRTLTRAHTLQRPTQTSQEIGQEAADLFEALWEQEADAVRLLGVAVNNLTQQQKQQQMLFDQPASHKAKRIDSATDAIRDKFGAEAMRRGSSLAHRVKFRADPRVSDQTPED